MESIVEEDTYCTSAMHLMFLFYSFAVGELIFFRYSAFCSSLTLRCSTCERNSTIVEFLASSSWRII